MTEESDDSDSSDSSDSRWPKTITTLTRIVLCGVQVLFFVYMIAKFMELDFTEGFKFMTLAYSSAFAYYVFENSSLNPSIIKS
jgi:hypothetical protein